MKRAETPPGPYEAALAEARNLVTRGELDAARDRLATAIAAAPTRAEAFNLLGAVHELSGDDREAERLYRAAVDLDPTYAPAARNLERLVEDGLDAEIDLG